MKTICQVAVFGLTLAVFSPCVAQSTTPAPSHPASKRSQGFVDYALGKINPGGKDYGSSAADARSEVVANTIQDLYFWSNIVSLTLLAATSAALVLVLRTQDKREIIAANLITQLWNGRVIDRQEIVRRTGMYNALVEAKNAALAMKPTPPTEQEPVPATVTSAGSEKPLKKSGVQKGADVSRSPSSQRSRGEIGGLPSLNVQEKSRLLESQNQALRDVERNLRERLNQLSQDLEQERLRNQALKGA